MSLPIIVLIGVVIGIALYQWRLLPVKIWMIMSLGALILMFTGRADYAAIKLDVMVFLFGIFVLSSAFEESGLLMQCMKGEMTANRLLLLIFFVIGPLAALFMNDTLAIVATPLVLRYAVREGYNARHLLIALAFAITIGSVTSPIGNPQNLLIASTIDRPFWIFLKHLFLPTVFSLGVAYAWMHFTYRKGEKTDIELPFAVYDPYLSSLVGIAAALIVIGMVLHISLFWVGFIPALLLIAFSRNRWRILKHVHYQTLIFFLAMFIVTGSIDLSPYLKYFPKTNAGLLVSSTLISQITSNVPFVALLLPWVKSEGGLMALAAGSTLAGNLFLFGAASNVIINDVSEKRGYHPLPFFKFLLLGTPLTVVCLIIYYTFLG